MRRVDKVEVPAESAVVVLLMICVSETYAALDTLMSSKKAELGETVSRRSGCLHRDESLDPEMASESGDTCYWWTQAYCVRTRKSS